MRRTVGQLSSFSNDEGRVDSSTSVNACEHPEPVVLAQYLIGGVQQSSLLGELTETIKHKGVLRRLLREETLVTAFRV